MSFKLLAGLGFLQRDLQRRAMFQIRIEHDILDLLPVLDRDRSCIGRFSTQVEGVQDQVILLFCQYYIDTFFGFREQYILEDGVTI